MAGFMPAIHAKSVRQTIIINRTAPLDGRDEHGDDGISAPSGLRTLLPQGEKDFCSLLPARRYRGRTLEPIRNSSTDCAA